MLMDVGVLPERPSWWLGGLQTSSSFLKMAVMELCQAVRTGSGWYVSRHKYRSSTLRDLQCERAVHQKSQWKMSLSTLNQVSEMRMELTALAREPVFKKAGGSGVVVVKLLLFTFITFSET